MRDDLTDKEKRVIQKAEMLEEFGQVKKKNIIASVLTLLLGFTGAHRIYLGQIGLGIGIFIFWVIAYFGDKFYGIDVPIAHVPLRIVTLLYIAFLFAEMFQISTLTDKVNDRIRGELEDKYYR